MSLYGHQKKRTNRNSYKTAQHLQHVLKPLFTILLLAKVWLKGATFLNKILDNRNRTLMAELTGECLPREHHPEEQSSAEAAVGLI